MSAALTTLRRLVVLNTVLIGLTSLSQIYLFVRVHELSAPPAAAPAPTVQGSRDPAAAPSAPGGVGPLEHFLASTMAPLERAATELGQQVQLPSDAEVAACVATGDPGSAACAQVQALLQRGYEQVGMPFPAMMVAATGASPPTPGAPAGAPTAGAAGGAEAQVLTVYLDAMQGRLRQAALAAGDDPERVLPSASAVAAAVDSGDPRSPASEQVLSQLRAGYARYGLRFNEPWVGAAGGALSGDPGANDSATDQARVQLLASYFDHVLEKLDRAARDKGMDPATLRPSAQDVGAAAATGRADSAESIAVLSQLRGAYVQVGLAFTEPPL